MNPASYNWPGKTCPLMQSWEGCPGCNQPLSDWIQSLLHKLKPVSGPVARQVIGPIEVHTTIILLNRHSIKLTPNDLSLYP